MLAMISRLNRWLPADQTRDFIANPAGQTLISAAVLAFLVVSEKILLLQVNSICVLASTAAQVGYTNMSNWMISLFVCVILLFATCQFFTALLIVRIYTINALSTRSTNTWKLVRRVLKLTSL